ncbi:MAG: hypothetical protein ACLPYZ_03580, partial [Limisphaerales bacterium]
DHSMWGRETPVKHDWLRGECCLTPRPVAHVIKKPKGLNWEYQIAAANSHCPFSLGRDMKFERHHSKRKPAAGGCG